VLFAAALPPSDVRDDVSSFLSASPANVCSYTDVSQSVSVDCHISSTTDDATCKQSLSTPTEVYLFSFIR